MQSHCTAKLKGTLVEVKTRAPSTSLGTIAGTSTLKPLLVMGQSGDWTNYLTQDMETTFITTTSTELNPLNDKMIDPGQGACSVIPNNIMGTAEVLAFQSTLMDNSETAVFDVESDFLVDSGSGVFPFMKTEGLPSPHDSSREVGVYLSEKPTIAMPHQSLVNDGLSSECPSLAMLPHESGFVDSICSHDWPSILADSSQKHPASSDQHEDLELTQYLSEEIDKILTEKSEDISLDCVEQLDLNLFSQFDEPDALDIIVQECGLLNTVEEGNLFDEGELLKKERGELHNERDLNYFTTPVLKTSPTRVQTDCVGPVRTRHVRRTLKKPVRYRDMEALDDSTIAEVTTKADLADLEDLVASANSKDIARRKSSDKKNLSFEEKYLKSREQNNLASRRCRERRKQTCENMKLELHDLEIRNKSLQDKVAHLTVLRDDFKDFVNKFLFQRLAQK